MRVKNRLLMNYILIFAITSIIAVIAFFILSVVSNILENSLVKNKYTAFSIMKDNISNIETDEIIANNGGIQVIDSAYEIVLSKGVNHFPKRKLTISEFTEFLTQSQNIKRKYSYSVAYNENKKFWLIVTFPTSIRIDFNITHNSYYRSADTDVVIWFIVIVIMIYIGMLIISTFFYSRLTARNFTKPLLVLQKHANRLRNGEYSARVNLHLDNEIGELECALNEMADQIQTEIGLRKKSEEIRKQLTLDIAHDLKNPAYKLMMEKIDLSEYLRTKIAHLINILEPESFLYKFEIPEREIHVHLDEREMDRVFDNLFENAIRYNDKGTKISLTLNECDGYARIILSDDGKGIAKELSKKIFGAFVRTDEARNSETGGSGLGLAIAEKIIKLHGGNISLVSDIGEGCTFYMELPIHS